MESGRNQEDVGLPMFSAMSWSEQRSSSAED